MSKLPRVSAFHRATANIDIPNKEKTAWQTNNG